MSNAAVLRASLASPRVWRSVTRAGGIAAGVYGLFVFVVAPLTGHFSGEFEDFNAYWGAAHASAAHSGIYAAFTQQSQTVALSGFDYPPIVAWLLTPLASLSYHAAGTLWLLLDVVTLVAACVIVARTVLPEHSPRVELALLAAFLYAPAAYNLWHGQMNPVVFLLLALALRQWSRGREVSCGALIGAAAAIKLAPAVLVLLLLRRHWWRGAMAAAAVVVLSVAGGVLAFGAHTSLQYVQSVLPVLSREDGWLYNQSWNGVLNRVVNHSVLAFQPDVTALRVAALALSLVSVLAAAWIVRPGRADPDRRAAEFGAGILAMLLAGTITWYTHEVHMLIPLAATATLVARRRVSRSALTAALIVAVLATAVVARELIDVASMPAIVAASHGPWWWPLLQLASLPALSAAGLLLTTVVVLARERSAGAVAPALLRRGLASA